MSRDSLRSPTRPAGPARPDRPRSGDEPTQFRRTAIGGRRGWETEETRRSNPIGPAGRARPKVENRGDRTQSRSRRREPKRRRTNPISAATSTTTGRTRPHSSPFKHTAYDESRPAIRPQRATKTAAILSDRTQFRHGPHWRNRDERTQSRGRGSADGRRTKSRRTNPISESRGGAERWRKPRGRTQFPRGGAGVGRDGW